MAKRPHSLVTVVILVTDLMCNPRCLWSLFKRLKMNLGAWANISNCGELPFVSDQVHGDNGIIRASGNCRGAVHKADDRW